MESVKAAASRLDESHKNGGKKASTMSRARAAFSARWHWLIAGPFLAVTALVKKALHFSQAGGEESLL